MLKEIKPPEMVGKKIAGYGSSWSNAQMVILFSDNTFTTFKIDYGSEYGDERIVESTLDLLDFGDNALITLGIISKKELEAITSKRKKEFALKREQQELSEYNRLKAKFDGEV